MTKLKATLSRFFALDEDGATAIEYGLIAALLAISLIAALQNVNPGFDRVANEVNNVMTN